jgi:WD40 repeat protein
MMVWGILALAALSLAGCSDFILSPISTGPDGLIALTLDWQGEYLPAASGGGRLYLTDKRGSFLREISSPVETGFLGWPQLTPDGSQLFYLAGEEVERETIRLWDTFTSTKIKRWGIHLLDLQSLADTKLLESDDRILSLQLSPTGEQIAYAAESGDEPLIFFDGSFRADCSQTGSYKLFNNLKLYLMEIGLTPQSPPKEISAGVMAYRWSPDSESLLLLRESFTQCIEDDDTIGFVLAEIVKHDLANAEEKRLFTVALDPAAAFYAIFLPQAMLDWDGYEILLVTGSTVIEGRFQLYLLNYGGPAFISEDSIYPAFSPEGDKLAFIKHGDLPYLYGQCEPRGEIILVNYEEGLQKLAGPGCFCQLFWVSDEELGYVEQIDEHNIIWIHNLATGERFNLSAALATHLGER